MEFLETMKQISALPKEDRMRANNVFQRTNIGGRMLPKYEAHLAASTDYLDFFRRIYEDESLMWENAWQGAALKYYPDWPLRFHPAAVHKGALVENGAYMLKGTGGPDLAVPYKFDDTPDVYLFEEGQFPKDEVSKLGVVEGKYTLEGVEVEGYLAAYYTKGKIFLEHVCQETALELLCPT